jgi:hypothetical protein
MPRLSIVVQPFTNLSRDAKQDYFADGITENLTTDLSRLTGSFVIACNSWANDPEMKSFVNWMNKDFPTPDIKNGFIFSCWVGNGIVGRNCDGNFQPREHYESVHVPERSPRTRRVTGFARTDDLTHELSRVQRDAQHGVQRGALGVHAN